MNPTTQSQPPAGRAIAALLLAQVTLGIWPVVGAVVLTHMQPKALVGVRALIAGPLLFFIARPWRAKLSARDLGHCLGLAALGVVANQFCFVAGLARSSPTNSAIFGCLIPAWTLLFAVVLRQERPTWMRVGGIAFALAGALFLVGADRVQLGAERTVGNLFLLSSNVLYSLYLVLSRPLLVRLGAMTVVGWVFGLAVPLMLPLTGPSTLDVAWQSLPASVWWSLAYIVIGPSILGYLLHGYAMRAVPASTAAAFVYVQPLLTGGLSAWVLGERLGWQVIVAAALIFAGVAVVIRPDRQTQLSKM